jgi:hypothetical protein
MTILEDVHQAVDAATTDLRQAQASIATGVSEVTAALTRAREIGGAHEIERLSAAEAEITGAAEKLATLMADLERAHRITRTLAGAT